MTAPEETLLLRLLYETDRILRQECKPGGVFNRLRRGSAWRNMQLQRNASYLLSKGVVPATTYPPEPTKDTVPEPGPSQSIEGGRSAYVLPSTHYRLIKGQS